MRAQQARHIYHLVDKKIGSQRSRVRKGYDERREQVIKAAIDLFGSRGYNAVTIQMLATSCAMTKAGWLHYFGSKGEMLQRLLDELERQDTVLLAPIVMAGMTGGAKASRTAALELLDTLIGRFMKCPDMARFAIVLQCEAIDPMHPAYEWFRNSENTALDVLASLLASSSPNPLLVARHLYALMIGLGQQWLRASRDFDLFAAWREGSEAILPGARSSPP